MNVSHERFSGLRINWPDLFQDPGFLEFLNSGKATTWHSPGREVNEYSDVFILFDHGEGPDCQEMDEATWNKITQQVAAIDRNFEYGMLHLTNLDE